MGLSKTHTNTQADRRRAISPPLYVVLPYGELQYSLINHNLGGEFWGIGVNEKS